jgi:hypothetical protein
MAQVLKEVKYPGQGRLTGISLTPKVMEETVTYEDLRRQVILARDRLLDDRNEIQEWLRQNPNAEDRVQLANLRAELTAAVLRLYANGPVKFSRSRSNNNLPDNYTASSSSSSL